MRLALFVALPASALYLVLAQPIVVALFQRGRFGPAEAVETAAALSVQALGIAAVAGVRQLVPVYFAYGDTRTPVVGSTVNLLAFLAAALALRPRLGHAGIGLALSLANLAQLLFVWVLLRRRLPSLRLDEIAPAAGRALVACVGAAAAAWAAARAVAVAPDASAAARLLPAVVGCGVFVGAFLLAARLAGVQELGVLAAALGQRLRAGRGQGG
jgi:putative peptidoglycan lipid II flippase